LVLTIDPENRNCLAKADLHQGRLTRSMVETLGRGYIDGMWWTRLVSTGLFLKATSKVKPALLCCLSISVCCVL
jgi:hypothetical protein